MNPHALSVLEFRRALEAVAARAASRMGRERITALVPGADTGRIRAELERVSESRRLLEARPQWAPPTVPEAGDVLETLRLEGSVLDPGELLVVRRLFESSRELAGALERAVAEVATATAASADGAEAAGSATPETSGESPGPGGPPEPDVGPSLPAIDRLRSRLPDEPELEARLERLVDDEGEIRDDATPELKSIRGRLRAARGDIVRKLERYLSGLSDSYRVEDASVSVRDGRYVIPIRREGRSEVGGIIRGESATGATLFVEPPLAIRLMNELHELERDEAVEVQRILRDATGRIRPHTRSLAEGFDAQVDFDTLWARALTARAWAGTTPTLADPEDDTIRIVGGRHPLLLEQGVDVVPFVLEMEGHERVLVVSGPNTGGKTVLLKAVGLIQLLAQAGVVPPVAEGTHLPVARDVFADIGDEQSIAESLSTFSAHLANAKEILQGAGPGALVLIDELGTGTDPNEGAALARAILETLVERGARALVTSHLGALKRLDEEGSGIVNASLLFDSDRIAPTYQFQKGRPGRSFGLAIARRLGLSPDVLDRAEEYVDPGELEVEALLERLQRRERELSEALDEAETALGVARELRGEAEAREARIEERERTLERRAREEAREMLLEAREEVEAAIREVRDSADEADGEAAGRARRRVEEAVREQARRAPEERRGPRSPADVAEGDRVRVMGSGARGVVRSLRDDRVTVEVGGLRIEVPRGEVEPVAAGAKQAAGSASAKATEGASPPSEGGGWSAPDLDARHEVDLRGLRVEEVDLAFGRALDAAVVQGFSEIRIIHGKGTGAVRARVQGILDSDSRVESFRTGKPGEGGAGVTVATLR